MDIRPKDSQTLLSKLHNMSYSRSCITVCRLHITSQNKSFKNTMSIPCMSPAKQEKFIHVKCCSREQMYSNSMVNAGWLLSMRTQNIPFECTWLLKSVIFLSIFTFEHILCLLLSLIYPAMCLLNNDLCELSVS